MSRGLTVRFSTAQLRTIEEGLNMLLQDYCDSTTSGRKVFKGVRFAMAAIDAAVVKKKARAERRAELKKLGVIAS